VRAYVGAVAALAVIGAIGAAGCGGERSSHDAFVDDAGRICRAANAHFSEIEIMRPTADRAIAALESVMAIGADALADLSELEPPTNQQVEVSAWLGTLEQALDEVAYMHELLAQDRVGQAVAAAARADLLTKRAQTLARQVGLDRVCRVPRILPPT
jgi:hypothetical protein